jgi:8-oxo-dGTP diphosphatase
MLRATCNPQLVTDHAYQLFHWVHGPDHGSVGRDRLRVCPSARSCREYDGAGGPPQRSLKERKMPKSKRARFNPKKEISVMAWIENGQGAVLLVCQTAGHKLWTLSGGKVKRNESLESALKREVREETGLSVKAAEYLQMYDRPRRGAITILFRVAVQRQAVRTRLAAEEMADLGFFDRSPGNATPSAKFFCQAKVNALT